MIYYILTVEIFERVFGRFRRLQVPNDLIKSLFNFQNTRFEQNIYAMPNKCPCTLCLPILKALTTTNG
jgi:hypothetical protein